MRRRRRRPARARHSARSRRGRRRWSPGGGRRRAWTSSWYAGASWARMRSSRTRCNRTRYATRAGAPVEKTSFFRVMRFITRVTRETIVRRTFFCRPPFQHGGTETVLGKKRNKWRQSLRRARPEKRLRCTGNRGRIARRTRPKPRQPSRERHSHARRTPRASTRASSAHRTPPRSRFARRIRTRRCFENLPPSAMEAPRTVEDVADNFQNRREGLIKALTSGMWPAPTLASRRPSKPPRRPFPGCGKPAVSRDLGNRLFVGIARARAARPVARGFFPRNVFSTRSSRPVAAR